MDIRVNKKMGLMLLGGLLLVAVGCKRECVCYGYDELEHRFSEEEVEAEGGSCQNMIIRANTRLYSVCNWE